MESKRKILYDTIEKSCINFKHIKKENPQKTHLLYSFFYMYINNVNSYMYTNDVLLVTSAREALNNIQMQRSPRADA
jgi:hypothetical protein